jgi:hypothetical protein
VVDDLDVVPVRVEDERAVVTRVVDGALTGTAVGRGERGGVGARTAASSRAGKREMDVLGERPLVVD